MEMWVVLSEGAVSPWHDMGANKVEKIILIKQFLSQPKSHQAPEEDTFWREKSVHLWNEDDWHIKYILKCMYYLSLTQK